MNLNGGIAKYPNQWTKQRLVKTRYPDENESLTEQFCVQTFVLTRQRDANEINAETSERITPIEITSFPFFLKFWSSVSIRGLYIVECFQDTRKSSTITRHESGQKNRRTRRTAALLFPSQPNPSCCHTRYPNHSRPPSVLPPSTTRSPPNTESRRLNKSSASCSQRTDGGMRARWLISGSVRNIWYSPFLLGVVFQQMGFLGRCLSLLLLLSVGQSVCLRCRLLLTRNLEHFYSGLMWRMSGEHFHFLGTIEVPLKVSVRSHIHIRKHLRPRHTVWLWDVSSCDIHLEEEILGNRLHAFIKLKTLKIRFGLQ